MFEIKYKITDEDMKTVNKSIMWQYFVPYIIVALLGLGAGTAAIVLDVRTDIMVLGIILIVLGVILLGCTILLLIAPKNFVASALVTSDTIERTVKVGDERIDIETQGEENIELSYGEITKLKNKKTYLIAYVGKDIVLIIKDADVKGGKLDDVYGFISAKTQGASTVTSTTSFGTSNAVSGEEVKEEVAETSDEVKEETAVVQDKVEESAEESVEEKTEEVKQDAAEVKTEEIKTEEVKEEKAEKKAAPAKKTSTKKKGSAK